MPGIVDQDVDLAELRHRGIEGGFDRRVARDVDRLRGGRREAGRLQRREIAIPHHHLGAALRHQLRDAEPDPRAPRR
jgi:hypothetical protein